MSLGPAPSVGLSDVEWRVDSKPSEGDRGMRARFVPHINARIAARLMDEWVGPECWSDEYRTVTIAGKEALLCTVSVLVADRWITKQDVGVPTSTEAQKGGVSDAFKRCVTVKWGAGRNVYELPTLWAPCKAKNEKAYPVEQTLPDIMRQLKARGFEADGCKLEEELPEASGERQAGADEHPKREDPAPVSARPVMSANQLQHAQSRVKALQADNVSVFEERRSRGLPKLDEKLGAEQWAEWLQLISDLEATLEKPFVEAP